ncbi:MAG: ABC transporter permease [Actinomycetota bacterium]|jgi:ABC-2 type transport system permease protein|nr:ABC transporter permease [Actinomycetota bacterium]
MSASHQLRTQARFSLLSFRRNPAASFFTVVLPLIMLVLFTSIFGNEEISGTGVRLATVYVPGILALSVISATMVNLAIITTGKRESGILKRVRGTPLRPWVFVAGEVTAALLITVIMTVLVGGIGWLLYDVTLFAAGIPNLIVSLIVGAAAFSALGLALTVIIPNERAASAVTNMIVLPLYFVSDVFIPTSDDTPGFIVLIGDIFPIKHLSLALGQTFDPVIVGTPMAWGHWAVITAWGLLGGAIAARRFRWTPRG